MIDHYVAFLSFRHCQGVTQGNGRIDGQGGQVGGQGIEVNDGVDGVPDFSTIIAQQLQNLLPTILAQGDVRNVIENNDHRGYTYKEFLACNPKEYDGKGGAIVYTRWIEKMESVQDMSGCRDSQKVKYTAGSFVDFKTLTKEEFCLVNEIKSWQTDDVDNIMVGAGHAAYIDRFHELASNGAKYHPKGCAVAGTLIHDSLRNGSIK
ncbi:hypothetical protein Tco_0665555 [Tanacetum coccineum]